MQVKAKAKAIVIESLMYRGYSETEAYKFILVLKTSKVPTKKEVNRCIKAYTKPEVNTFNVYI